MDVGRWIDELRISEPQVPRSLPVGRGSASDLAREQTVLASFSPEQVPCIMMLVLKACPQHPTLLGFQAWNEGPVSAELEEKSLAQGHSSVI